MTYDPKEARVLVERLLDAAALYESVGLDGASGADMCCTAADTLTAALDEIERLRTNTERFPALMEKVMSEKNLSLPDRIERLKTAMSCLSENIAKYQWEADAKQAFGEKYVRAVVGENGEGTGRQWLASTPHHIDGLAEYIAAANPDTVALMLTEIATLRTEKAEAERDTAWNDAIEAAADEVTNWHSCDGECVRSLKKEEPA